MVFLDAQMEGDGRWIIPVGTLSVPSCVQSPMPVWHIPVCDPQKLHNSICFVEWPLLWQGCAIMWLCTCKGVRW